MRFTLNWKITTILVIFGVVPAAVVAWFAYNANDDYRNKLMLVIAKTADAINFRVATLVQKSPQTAESALDGKLSEPERTLVQECGE